MTRKTQIAKRHRRERRFQCYGLVALCCAGAMLLVLLLSLLMPGLKGMRHVKVTLDVPPLSLAQHASPDMLLKQSLLARFPSVESRRDKRSLYGLLASHAALYVSLPAPAAQSGVRVTVPLSSPAELWIKDGWPAEAYQRYGLNASQAKWLQELHKAGQVTTAINTRFFTGGDSRDPEKAGFGGGIIGSLFVLFVCIGVSLPIGVGAAIYLEEFAPKSRFRDIIEVNINNLAAIPSIIFGLLGLFVYIVLFGLPRSSALIGGLTLALMTLPVIIISTRVALGAVPKSLRDGARALGASKLQVVMHHVVPQALPGIITGAILGMARAIGETAPLLMIGMVAFIASPPQSLTDPSTAMPVQIYLWATSPEQGFLQKTASGILVLVTILLLLNLIATYMRSRSERRR
jgi:phosphate transport system permease protein